MLTMPVLLPDKVNMNYANMIEEKSLKKTFIIATLVSTLVGTFAASHNLYERLSQKKKDGDQDSAIKKLSERIDRIQNSNGEGGNDKSDELRMSLTSSGPLIRREYDVGFDRLGQRYAVGDIITENELQRQVILLQQTVIAFLEEALYSGRRIDPSGLDNLLHASQAARNGAIDALRGQYQRFLQALPPSRAQSLPPGVMKTEVIEASSHRSSSRRPQARQPRALLPPPPFYCRYSLDLQRRPGIRLARSFDPGSRQDSRCPTCKLRLPVDAADMWDIEFPVRRSSLRNGLPATRCSSPDIARFRVPARFVVKCHMPDGDYACALCCGPEDGYSGTLVLCEDPEALVDHVAREHRLREIEEEVDILPG